MASLKSFRVSDEMISEALNHSDPRLIDDMMKAIGNIKAYPMKQKVDAFSFEPEDGIRLMQVVRPMNLVGLYVPGGTASYPSTVLMNAIPAKLAGVKRLIMTTPPGKDGKIKASVLAAASLAGVDEIHMVGGAQAIAAMAYGTESIAKVDLITGPGNIYVATAKRLVYGTVGIDSVAGPTEVVILADEEANPSYIAADLMAQAEHDVKARSILVTTSKTLLDDVVKALEAMIDDMTRKGIIKEALLTYGMGIVVETMKEGIDLVNRIASEHLEIMTRDPYGIVPLIENAGAIFLGDHTPEPVGDYMAGPNHTLPTNKTSRFSSMLSTATFQKRISVIDYDQKALRESKDAIVRLANEEGLEAHAKAVEIRFKVTS